MRESAKDPEWNLLSLHHSIIFEWPKCQSGILWSISFQLAVDLVCSHVTTSNVGKQREI